MTTTVSTKYQIVIPKAVRQQLDIQPGQKLQVTVGTDGHISIVKDDVLNLSQFLDNYAGVIKTADTAWGKAGVDAADWIRQQRDEEWK